MKRDFVDYIIPNASYDFENNPWFLSYPTGLFGKIDFENKKINYYGGVGVGDCLYVSDYIDLISTDEKLFFIPSHQKEELRVLVYNIHTEEWEYIDLRKSTVAEEHKSDLTFVRGIRIDEYIFLVPTAYDAIVRINIKTYKVDYIDNWIREFENKLLDGQKYYFYGFVSRQFVFKDDFLYIPFAAINGLIKINVKTLEDEIVYLNSDSLGFSCIYMLNDDIFLLTGGCENPNYLYIWRERENKIECKIQMQSNSGYLPVIRMVADAKDKVYLFPWQNMGNDCLDLQIFNWKTKEIKNAGLINSDDENQRERIVADEIVFVSKNKDACVRFVTGKDLQWHEYYVDSGEHRSFKIKADFSNEQNMRVLIDYYKKFKAEGHPLSEQQIVLKKYIEEIVC